MDIHGLIKQKYRTYQRRRNWYRFIRAIAVVVVFCTSYALILPAITMETKTVCGLAEHTHTEACYVRNINCEKEEQTAHSHTEACLGTLPTLVCTETDAEHNHVATCYFYEAGHTCGQEETEGHSHIDSCFQSVLSCSLPEHAHSENCYPAAESEATGETTLPDGELNTEPATSLITTHIHLDREGTLTQVILPGDTTVPADVVLSVTAVTADDERYAAMAEQLQALTGNAVQMTLLDISFYDAAGEYLRVSDTAQVSIHFAEDIFGSGTVKVFHFVDGVPVELEKVSVNRTVAAAGEEAESVQAQLAFETEGFSVFAVVTVAGDYEQVTTIDTTQMAGDYYILNDDPTRAMMAAVTTANIHGYSAIEEKAVTDPSDLSGCSLWTLEWVSGSSYRICATDANGVRQYLEAVDVNNIGSNWDLGALVLTEDEAAASVFTMEAVGTKVRFSVSNGIVTRYITDLNDDTLGDDYYGFTAHTATNGSQLTLYRKVEETQTTVPLAGLDGKSFAIVSNAKDKALTTTTAQVNDVPGLKAQDVSLTTVDNTRCFVGDVPLWTFDATDTEGVYHVSTEIDGGKQYLTFLAQHYDASKVDGRGSLTLTDSPQDIYVTANADGTVCLSVKVGNVTGYINLDIGSDNFWVYKEPVDRNKLLLCKELPNAGLIYNLNAPAGATWINAPSISEAFQLVTGDGTALLSVEGGNAVGSFVDNTLSAGKRGNVTSYYNAYNNGLGNNLTADNYLAPGAEWHFLGWQADASDGNTYLFPENASAALDSDGCIRVADVDGIERTLYPNTTLTGQWKKRCEVVLFFVNFGDTMLDTEDHQPIVSYSSNYYTGVVAIGHIYNPEPIFPGRNEADTHDTIERCKDAKIQAEIVPTYDPSITSPQIVIDAVAQLNDRGSFEYVSVSNFNQTRLETSVGQYLQDDPDSSTQIKIDDAHVDKSEITAENYKLYWYLQKEENEDGWHIDGVLVAKTQPMEIYKTFSGLTDDEAAGAIQTMTFPLGLIRENESDAAEKQTYTILTANGSREGLYTNDGRQGSSQIYKWTLQSIQGQRYAFEEEGYQVDGHDWSGLISAHYTDGSVEYRYNTDTTFDTSDLFGDKPLVGGSVESVIFANFYTAKGTGMFSVSKVADEAGRVRLPGAVFTLEDSNNQVVATVTTNENGAAHFADLAAGTYKLTEDTAPGGYQSVSTTWTVEVASEESSGRVTVTIRETGSSDAPITLYDNQGGGIRQVYLIQNTPESRTMTVNKYFSEITDTEVKELTGYCIEVQKSDGSGEQKTLTLSNATPITGSMNGYTWTLELEPGTEYTFVETNFLHRNYLDTVVTAAMNGTAVGVKKSDANTTAAFTVTKSGSADTVDITNAYTNTFLLRIRKVDATNNDAAMKDVKFNIYGDFEFHKTPPTGVSATIDYTGENGNQKQAYYIGTTEATDASGVTQFVNMRLSSGSNSFLYVIDEANTPAGYIKLDEPIVRVVEVNGGDPNYDNGVYTLTVENHQEAYATVTVTANKLWKVEDGSACPPVTLTLYKKTADGAVTKIGEATLDGSSSSETTDNGITVTVTGWQVAWSGLTYADGSSRNEYYVSETELPGYSTSYSTEVSTLAVDGQQVKAAAAEGYNLQRAVTVTNAPGYALPNTGGSGTRWLVPLGLLLMAAAALAGCCLERSRLPALRKSKGNKQERHTS